MGLGRIRCGLLVGGLGGLLLAAQQELQVGYAVLHSEDGQVPTTAALFSFRNSEGVLESDNREDCEQLIDPNPDGRKHGR